MGGPANDAWWLEEGGRARVAGPVVCAQRRAGMPATGGYTTLPRDMGMCESTDCHMPSTRRPVAWTPVIPFYGNEQKESPSMHRSATLRNTTLFGRA